jgi:tetratricopeptide (TPR) repeat protein
MQQGMLTVAASLRAHGATAVVEATAEIDAIADANAIRPTALARAEVDLVEGRASEAREGLERVVKTLTTDDLRRDLTHALELLARALNDLGQWEDALDVCDRGLLLCEDTGAAPLAWRLRGCRAHVLDQVGRSDEAADNRARANTEFGTLARRIPDPELQGWFNRQPLAARWLG